MSIENFIPTIWSARMLVNLKNALVYASDLTVNRDWEGEIREVGDTVRINSIGAVTISDYTKNVDMASPQELFDATTTFTVNQQKSFNFQVDDLDALQQKPKVMDTAMSEAAYAMRSTIDSYVANGMVNGVASANKYNSGSAVAIGAYGTDTRPYDLIVKLGVILTENNVPGAGRWVIVPPWVTGALLLDDRFVSFGTDANRNTLLNGRIGRAAGFDIFESNNVPRSGSSSEEYTIVAGHRMATTFAEKLTKVEAYRPEKRFSDAVKGLALYGAKVVRPTVLASVKVTVGTQTPGS